MWNHKLGTVAGQNSLNIHVYAVL